MRKGEEVFGRESPRELRETGRRRKIMPRRIFISHKVKDRADFRAVRKGCANVDIDKVHTAFAGMLRLNKEYMICAAGRYQELLKEMA